MSVQPITRNAHNTPEVLQDTYVATLLAGQRPTRTYVEVKDNQADLKLASFSLAK
jgi:hypothetical protein